MSTADTKRPPLAVVILAAGLGTRMKSDVPKVLHQVCGRPMLSYVIDAALSVSPERIVVVTGPDQGAIEEILPVGCERAVQQERRGTGDAVRAGLEPLHGFEGDVMVLYGDVPLVDGDFVAALHQRHLDADAAATLTTVDLDDPAHYGRIVRDAARRRRAHRRVHATRPARSARSTRSTSGLYVFRSDALRPALQRLGQRQRPGRAVPHRRRPPAASTPSTRSPRFESDDEEMCMGVNSRVELAVVNAAMRRRLLERLMLAGVTVEDPGDDLRRLRASRWAATRSSAPTRTCSGAPPSARPARSAPAASCATPSSATARASSARTSTSASSAPAATSGPSPTSAPTPCSPRAPRPAPSSRSRTAASASAARCRTSATSATPSSAWTATSPPATSPPTTTATTSTRRTSATACAPAATRRSSPRSASATTRSRPPVR